MMNMFGGFSAQKLKPQLKMATNRIAIASNKKSALLKQNMREVAVMLAEDPPKEEKAKIRAESLIRDDNMIEAYEILQLECELLHERIKLIEFSTTCPSDMVSVISTVIWASQRVDIPELLTIRKQFRAKYGKTFEEAALNNVNGVLNERVVSKLSVDPPAAYLVQTYLERICEQFQVNWKPQKSLTAVEMAEPMAAPVGYSVHVGTGTGLGPQAADVSVMSKEDDTLSSPPVVEATPMPPSNGTSRSIAASSSSSAPPSAPTTDFDEPDIFIPGPAPTNKPGTTSTSKDNDDDDDLPPPAPGSGGGSSYADLAARFDQLSQTNK